MNLLIFCHPHHHHHSIRYLLCFFAVIMSLASLPLLQLLSFYSFFFISLKGNQYLVYILSGYNTHCLLFFANFWPPLFVNHHHHRRHRHHHCHRQAWTDRWQLLFKLEN